MACFNPKCVHNMPHPCEECGYYQHDEEYYRLFCKNENDDGYKPHDDIEALS